MRFRISDLVFLTTAVALFIAAFQTDLQFFRQLFCFGLITAFATAAVVCFSTPRRSPRLIGAIGGLVGGLLYASFAYLLVSQIYPFEPVYLIRQSLVKEVQYLTWTVELFPFLAASPFLGSAIGPLLALRIRNTNLPDQFTKSTWLSVILLAAAFLLALFAMFDRLTLFGDSRDWSPLIFVLLVVFAIYTNSWLARIPPIRVNEEIETDVGSLS